MNRKWQGFRLVMMVLMTLTILFSMFAIYKHIITEGLIILVIGILGLIFYSFRLGNKWNGESFLVNTTSKEETKS